MADFEEKAPRPLVLLYGALQSKDSYAFLRHFVGLAGRVLTLPISGEQVGRDPHEVAAQARTLGFRAESCAGVETALRALAAEDWPQPPRIIIAGSLYLAGEVLRANGTEPD